MQAPVRVLAQRPLLQLWAVGVGQLLALLLLRVQGPQRLEYRRLSRPAIVLPLPRCCLGRALWQPLLPLLQRQCP